MNILKQIEQGESKIIEFKEQMPHNSSIVKTVIAFSNTSGIQKVRKLCVDHDIDFELNEKGTFVEALFYRPMGNSLLVTNTNEVPNNAEYDRIAGEEVSNTGEYRRIPANKIIEYIQKHGSVTSKDLQSLVGIKTSRAKEILSTMIHDGILEKVGKTRGSYYILKNSKEEKA